MKMQTILNNVIWGNGMSFAGYSPCDTLSVAGQ